MKKLYSIILLLICINFLEAHPINNNRTIIGFSANTIGKGNWQYCPMHLLMFFNRYENLGLGAFDSSNFYPVSSLLDIRYGLTDRWDVFLIGTYYNIIKSDYFMYTTGVKTEAFSKKHYAFSIPQLIKFKLNDQSHINFIYNPLINTARGFFNEYIYIDFESSLFKNFQYILFNGYLENPGLHEYFIGAGIRAGWTHLHLQLGLYMINPGIAFAIWFDF